MKHKMIATKSLTYAQRSIKVGDEFDALDDKDAMILSGIGKALRVDGKGFIETYPVPVTREVKASEPEDDEPERQNRRYRRRDLQAEKG